MLNEYIVYEEGWFVGNEHPTISDLQIILKLELNSRHFYVIYRTYITVMPKQIKLCHEYEKKVCIIYVGYVYGMIGMFNIVKLWQSW